MPLDPCIGSSAMRSNQDEFELLLLMGRKKQTQSRNCQWFSHDQSSIVWAEIGMCEIKTTISSGLAEQTTQCPVVYWDITRAIYNQRTTFRPKRIPSSGLVDALPAPQKRCNVHKFMTYTYQFCIIKKKKFEVRLRFCPSRV
jgi:hypothetical protein